MIVRERDDHDGSDHDLAVDDDGSVFDGVHSWSGGNVLVGEFDFFDG